MILDYGPSDLRVEIVDDGAPVGRRLLGLRERVAVYGGKVQAAPGGTTAGASPPGCRSAAPTWRRARPWRRLRETPAPHRPALLGLAVRPRAGRRGIIEIATIDDLRGPLIVNLALIVLVVPAALLRRSRPLVAIVIWGSVALLMAAFLTQPSELNSLFLGLILFPWAVGSHAEGRASVAGLVVRGRRDRRRRARLRRVRLGRHLLPGAFADDVLARGPRRAQPQPPDRRAARGRGARCTSSARPTPTRRSPRSGGGSRARCTTSSPTASRRWSSRPAARAASSPATRLARSRRRS